MTDKLYIFFDTETTGMPRNYKAPTKVSDSILVHSKAVFRIFFRRYVAF